MSRASLNTAMRASFVTVSRSNLAVNSGPMPAASPCTKAMRGLFAGWFMTVIGDGKRARVDFSPARRYIRRLRHSGMPGWRIQTQTFNARIATP